MTKFVLASGFITALLLLPLFAPAARAAETIKVVASFSIIADLANQIGGERTEVTALVGPNTDMHVFQPSPIDAKRLRDARVVIMNGLGFEGWAPRLAKASGFKGQLVVASKGVKLLRMEDSESHEHAGSGGHGKERQGLVGDRTDLRDIRLAYDLGDLSGRKSLGQTIGKLVEFVVIVMFDRTLGELDKNFGRS